MLRFATARALVGCLFLCIAAIACSEPGGTDRVSVSSSGGQGSNDSGSFGAPSITPDGRFLAFESDAPNLVAGDTNGGADVFVRDRLLGTTDRVSLSSSGEQANGGSGLNGLAISADGRFVTFDSFARNLVPNDTGKVNDIFVRDPLLLTTERMSVSTSGEQAIYPDGIGSYCPCISADGRFVAFISAAYNLVQGDNNGANDIFVRDRLLSVTELVSVSASGGQANGPSGLNGVSISADGRLVAFDSAASNLVSGGTGANRGVFVRDRQLGTTELVSVSSGDVEGNSWSELPCISADGRFVAFRSLASNLVPGDSNGKWDVFLRDRQLRTTERVSVSSNGDEGNDNSGYYDYYIYYYGGPAVSADGRFVAFGSHATNLVPNDTNGLFDIFVRDRLLQTTERVSVSSNGVEGKGLSLFTSMSADGAIVAFTSWATNLVPGDTNGRPDVFVRERPPGRYASGTITFDLLAPTATPPSEVTMRIKLNGVSLGESWTVPVAPDGSYTVSVPTGQLELAVKYANWLRTAIAVDTTGGNVTGADLFLVNGDAWDTNHVDLLDLSTVLGNYGSTGIPPFDGDLNWDGKVDLLDLSIVLSNFGAAGDP